VWPDGVDNTIRIGYRVVVDIVQLAKPASEFIPVKPFVFESKLFGEQQTLLVRRNYSKAYPPDLSRAPASGVRCLDTRRRLD
jgi:hypothetical protein